MGQKGCLENGLIKCDLREGERMALEIIIASIVTVLVRKLHFEIHRAVEVPSTEDIEK